MLRTVRNIYKLLNSLEIVEGAEKTYLRPKIPLSIGSPSNPFIGLFIDEKTFTMIKTLGSDYEHCVLTYDPTLTAYILKPAKGGTGTLFPIVFSGDGSTRALQVNADNKVGVGRAPDTYPFEVQGNAQVIGQQRIEPGSAMAPFVLNANAQNQLVTGLNADKLDGLHASDLPGSIIASNFTFAQVTGTTAETDVVSFTIPANTLSAGKALYMAAFLHTSFDVGTSKILRVKFGGQTYFDSSIASGITPRNGGILEFWLFAPSGASANTAGFAQMLSEKSYTAFPMRFGDANFFTITLTSSQVLKITIDPSSTGDSLNFYGAYVKLMV